MSQSLDFAQPLAEQIKNELALECLIVEKPPVRADVQLVITTEKNGKYPCPVIRITPDKTPLSLQKLLAQISELLQNHASQDAVSLGFGLTLQPRAKQLKAESGAAIDLTDKETQLLKNLAEAGAQGVSKEQLLKNVWGHDNPLDTHTLETHIYRLRGKLREVGADDSMIAATPGGYKLG